MSALRPFLCATAACLLVGCASFTDRARIETPNVLIGTLTHPRATGWYRDQCNDNSLTTSLDRVLDYADCLAHHAVVYRMRLIDARTWDGRKIEGAVEIALNAHGFHRAATIDDAAMVLQPAPPAFERATGIRWFATAIYGYDAERQCFEGHWQPLDAHLRSDDCPDRDFHRRNIDRCIPIEQFLAHHRDRRR